MMLRWGEDDEKAEAPDHAGIVGAGTMGTAVAALHLRHGFRVLLLDAAEDACARASERTLAELRGTVPRGEEDNMVRRRLSVGDAHRMEDLSACGVVIECATEDVRAKRAVLRSVEEVLRPGALLATNTSSLPLSSLADALARPSRFTGMHFFSPVRERPLVEIAAGPWTDADAEQEAVAHVRRLGHVPLRVPDAPGFVVNRLLAVASSQALRILAEGERPDAVDRAMTEAGSAMGPLAHLDLIGLDTALRVGWLLAGTCGDRVAPSPLLTYLVKEGQCGRKSGAGFYVYPRGTVNPLVLRLQQEWGRGGREGNIALAFSPPCAPRPRSSWRRGGCDVRTTSMRRSRWGSAFRH